MAEVLILRLSTVSRDQDIMMIMVRDEDEGNYRNSTQLFRCDDVYVTKCKLGVRQHIIACVCGEVLLRPVSQKCYNHLTISHLSYFWSEI
jgi:hypothetical protein